MKQQKKVAINELIPFTFLAVIVCALFAAFGWQEGETGFFVGFVIVDLIIFANIIFRPLCYVFDDDGVTLCYLFFPKARYLWKNIHSITVKVDSGADTTIWDLFLSDYFKLDGKVEGKHRFYMVGEIRKTVRTKRLLEKYWDGTITGYLFEDIKGWWGRRRAKKQRAVKQHLTEEIVPMEREARARARKVISDLSDRAALRGLELRAEYIYITNDCEELKSRPENGYTYTVLVEISYPGETDEHRIVCTSVDLLRVRLGKTAYRGVEVRDAISVLKESVMDALKEIETNGIEAYCSRE